MGRFVYSLVTCCRAATPLVEQQFMMRPENYLNAAAIPTNRPGLSVLPNQQHLARAGEMLANTTTYSAHLNQLPNRQRLNSSTAWLSNAPRYAEAGASGLFRFRQQLAQNNLTDTPLTEAESFGT